MSLSLRFTVVQSGRVVRCDDSEALSLDIHVISWRQICLFEILDKKAMDTWRLLERGRTYANHSDGATEVLRITVA